MALSLSNVYLVDFVLEVEKGAPSCELSSMFNFPIRIFASATSLRHSPRMEGPMTLALTIFLLTLFAEIVNWIGSTVLLNLVRPIHSISLSYSAHNPLAVLHLPPIHLRPLNSPQAKSPQERGIDHQARASPNQRTRPICQMG